MEETINYRGYNIIKRVWKPNAEPYKTIDSNYFELTEEDLGKMLEDLNKKAATLDYEGIKFKNLRYNFDVCEDHSDDDYYPYDAECEISLLYDTPETDKEAEDRIKNEEEYIDRAIEEEISPSEVKDKETVNQYEIEEAIRLLEGQGYTVKQK
jgi:hypothetical protein